MPRLPPSLLVWRPLGVGVGVGAVRPAMAEQLEAMLREIERRQAALTARELVD